MLTLRAFAATLVLAGLCLTPRPAAAVTVDQIVALSKAGVSEAVILALLDRDRTVLSIDPEQVVALKRQGLSDTLIVAMLRNGREEAEEAARAVSEDKAASILATLPLSSSLPAPDLVVVGHSPDRPNASYSGFRTGRSRGVYAPPDTYASRRDRDRYDRDRFDRYDNDPVMCIAQVNTPNGRGPSYVTVCPSVMQPRRIR